MRTLAFCTTYVGADTPSKGRWDTRYRRWVEALRVGGLRHDRILMVDDGSPDPPAWPDCVFTAGRPEAAPCAPLLMHHFEQRLGRKSVSDFPGWVRSFFFAAEFAVAHGFDRVVHLESDAFLLGEAVTAWANRRATGWAALWSTRYGRPESAIQVIAGDGIAAWREYARQPVERLSGLVIEEALPFTTVERRFVGDRYTEYLDHVPRDAEWCVQAECPDGADPAAFFWWLPPRVANPVRPSTLPDDAGPDHTTPTGGRNHRLPSSALDAMPVHDLQFERQLDLSEFAAGDTAQRLDLFAGGLSLPPRPTRMMAADGTVTEGELQYRANLPAISLYSLPGHVLGGGGAARGAGAGRSVFWREDCVPNYFRDVFAQTEPGLAHPWAGSLGEPSAEIVEFDHPIACVMHRNVVYGHALLEMLPRAWLIGRLAAMGRPLHVAVDADAPEWLSGLVELFVSPDRIVRYDATRQVLRAPAVVMPAMMQMDYYLHPAFNLLVDDVLDRVLGTGVRPAPDRKLFLSRRGLGELTMVANADALEQRLVAAGYEVLRPETMGFADQIRAYAGAAVMVSEYGSASHNALFAPRGSTHVVVNRINAVQERIAALRGQSLGILEPQGGAIMRVNIDPSTWRRAAIDADAILRLVELTRAQIEPTGPTMVAVTRETIEVGGYVASLDDGGAKPVLAPQAEIRLPAFLCHDPVDPATAPFARLFLSDAPQNYTAQAVVCARLGGASVLGDSGLVVWRGQVPADTADRGDWARAAGMELVAAPNGRPAPVPFDRRSHPGQALYQAFTGRWSEDTDFLIECLPRLVAYARLVGPDAALVPPSPAGSIQRRALDLLGLTGVETIGPDQVATGSAVWLPSGIDPWQPTPLVIAAAQALADRVPPVTTPTPRRIYLRGHDDVRPPLRGFAELGPVLAAHGFEAVTLSDHDLDRRVALMRGAEIVVGEAASGLAHVAFCRPSTRVLELFNPVFVQPATYALAALGELGYGFLVGVHVAEPDFEQPSLASAYTVSPARLDAALAALAPAPVTETPNPVATPDVRQIEPARTMTPPAPFFAAPALAEGPRDAPAVVATARAGVAIDGRGTLRPAQVGDRRIGSQLIAAFAPAGVDPLLGVLPRLLAIHVVRQGAPGARVVLPSTGPARRLAELLNLADGAVVLDTGSSVTGDLVWQVDGIDPAPDRLPSDLLRRAGEALRDAVPTNEPEKLGLVPTRVLICAAQPDPQLQQTLTPQGFVPVAWGGLSVDEQIRLMRSARLVVLEPGHAGCLVLARPSATRALEAGHPTARGLAAICGVEYGCVGDVAALDAAIRALVG